MIRLSASGASTFAAGDLLGIARPRHTNRAFVVGERRENS
jgi:hypothetical protein